MGTTKAKKPKTPKGVFVTTLEFQILKDQVSVNSTSAVNQNNANLKNTAAIAELAKAARLINERLEALIEMLKRTAAFEEQKKEVVEKAALEAIEEAGLEGAEAANIEKKGENDE